MTQLAFSFNADECTGCKACVAACKDVKNLPVGFQLRKVVTAEAGSWQRDPATGLPVPHGVFAYSVSSACMHCSKPACVEACPTGAMGKDGETGVVAVNEKACIGCGCCVRACPWDAPVVVPAIDGSLKSRKCDFCQELLGQGEEPACVAACLMRCLGFGPAATLHPNAPWGEPMLADAPELGPNLHFVPNRRREDAAAGNIRLHSMSEEYAHG